MERLDYLDVSPGFLPAFTGLPSAESKVLHASTLWETCAAKLRINFYSAKKTCNNFQKNSLDTKFWKQNLHNVYVKIISPYIFLNIYIYRGMYLIFFIHVPLARWKEIFPAVQSKYFLSALEKVLLCTAGKSRQAC